MTLDQITQIRQTLNEAQDFAKDSNIKRLDSIDANQTYKWIMQDMFRCIDQALALLPCETCKRCGGVNGKHKQVDDPQAGNSHMLTKMPCPNDMRSFESRMKKSLDKTP